MQNDRICGECNGRNVGAGGFCRHCGKPLDVASTTAGRAVHMSPLPKPSAMSPVDSAADLYFRTESAFGGPTLIGTEALGMILYNGGFTLRSVVIHIEGFAKDGSRALDTEKSLERLPRGLETRVEVPSYEIDEPLHRVKVSFVSAEYT
jgi:hypothetical protein